MFEMLGSLAYSTVAYSVEKLKDVQDQAVYVYVPVGRLAWQYSVKESFFKNVEASGLINTLRQVGFSKGNPEHMKASISNLLRLMDRYE